MLTITAGIWMSYPWGCECWRAGPVSCLPCNDTGKEEMTTLTLPPCNGKQENWPRGHLSRRAGPAPHLLLHLREQALLLHLGITVKLALGMGVASEPALPLVCWVVSPFSPPRPSTSTAGRRAGPRVMRVGELAMSHTSCTTQKSRPCTLLGQQGRPGPGSGGC